MPATPTATGFVFDERFLGHDTGTEDVVTMRKGTFTLSSESHPSAASITRRIKELLDGCDLSAMMQPIAARAANEDELAVYHTHAYIDGLRVACRGGPKKGNWGEVETDTPLSEGSFEAAMYAAGGAINAADAVLCGDVRNAYALLRPPGHHAMSNRGMGFCLLNNAVVAAQYARRTYQLERVMIVDWDVHHGNGTQDAFYHDPHVLFLSLHQENWYPRLSGELEQVGSGAGVGKTVNIPLPAGTGDRGYRAAFEQLVVPIGLQFRPELLIVSAGQDACWLDPLAQQMMTMSGFREIAMQTVRMADEVCQGRLALLQEGGYSAAYAPYCTAAVVEPLLGADLGIVDLYDGSSEVERAQTVFSDETRAALTKARQWHQQWWKL
jgi:acetoin utilization deacetylase AcuC-like enzyme